MDINKYIPSEIVERYAMGLVSSQEAQEFEQLVQQYPELKQAVLMFNMEVDLIVQANKGLPPAETWAYIEKQIDEKKAPE